MQMNMCGVANVLHTKMISTILVVLLCCVFATASLPSKLPRAHDRNRMMAIGDFEELNQLLRTAVIRLPNLVVSKNLITVDITNLRCQNFQVGDILIDSRKDESQQVTLTIEVQELDLTCYFDYEYNTLVFNGRGSANVVSTNNEAQAVTLFSSSTMDTSPALKAGLPTDATLNSCAPQVNIDDMNFEGSMLAIVLDRIEGLLRNTVEGQAEDLICEELGSMTSSGYVAEFLVFAQETLALYPPQAAEFDALASEKTLVVPSITKLLNFGLQETELGKWLDMALKEMYLYLGKQVQSNDNTGGATDMNVNVLIRDYLLEDGSYSLDLADLPFLNDGFLWTGHDRFSETTIKLNKIEILGLDTFTQFDPLVSLGNYTFQNNLSWEYLSFELDVTINIKPSSLENSIIEVPGSTNVVENVKIMFGVEKIKAAASFLLAVDREALEDLTVGSLLWKDKVLPCFLSTLFHVELTGFTVEIGSVVPPTMENFVSPGMDRLVSSGLVDTAFLMYKDALLEAAPSFFQTTLRQLINKKMQETIESLTDSSACSMIRLPDSETGFVDFLELLRSTEKYGDSVSTVLIPMLQNQLVANGDDGLPKINSRLIHPFTKINSGEEGTIQVASNLFNFAFEDFRAPWSPLLERVELTGFNATLRNLDTVAPPLLLLEPTEGHVITNVVNVGQESLNPLNFTLNVLLSVNGDEDSPLNMRNEIVVSIAVPSASCWIDLLAKVRETALVEFPLKDIDNRHCWLATIPSVETEKEVLELSKFLVTFASVSFSASCVECLDPDEDVVSEIMEVLEQAGMSFAIQPHFEKLVNELVWSYWQHLQVDQMIQIAPKLCPHHPEYDAAIDSRNIDLSGFKPPRAVVETIFSFGTLLAQSFAVASARSHLLQETTTSDPLSGQAWLAIPEDSRILDWADLSKHLGDWAGQVMDSARDYLGSIVEDSEGGGMHDLGANVLVRRVLLGEDDMYTMNFEDLQFEVAGFIFSVTNVRIHGLDTLSKINAFVVIGPQTFQNHLAFEKLKVIIDIEATSAPSGSFSRRTAEQMTISFAVNEVTLDLAFLLAVDIESIGKLELGSVLVIKQAIACLLTSVHEMEVTQMLVSIGEVENLQIDGFVSPALQESVAPLRQALFDAFYSDLILAVPNFFDVTFRGVLNGILRSHVKENPSLCTSLVPAISGSQFVDFRDLLLSEPIAAEFGGTGMSPYGDLFQALYDLLNQEFLLFEADSGASINDLLGSWTKRQSNTTGSFVYSGDVINTTTAISVGGLQANLEFKISDARIDNMDSFGAPLELTLPILGQPHGLNNTVSFGVGPDPLRVTAKVLVALYDDDSLHIRNEMLVRIDLSTFRVVLAVILKISEEPLFSFPLQDIFSLSCWLVTVFTQPGTEASGYQWDFESIAIMDNSVSVEQLDLTVSCVSCTSPDFDKLVYQLYSPEGDENATRFVNNFIDQGGRIIGGDFFQERVLNDAAHQCPHSRVYDPNATAGESSTKADQFLGFRSNSRDAKSVYFTVANAVFAVVLGLMVGAWKFFIHRRNRKRVEALSSEDTALLLRQQGMELDLEKDLNEKTDSMFRSSIFPRRVRLMVPFVLLLDMGLYLGAHLGVISTVNIFARVGGESVTIDRFLDFEFIGSTVRTYRNGGSEMAILLFIFSFLWPYFKLISSMIVFFAPPRKLSVSRRGSILLWLDVFARMSIVDIFLMLLAIGALLVYAGGPASTAASEGEPFFVKLIVVPRGGFYSFLIAQRISRISSRFLLDYHRKVVDSGTLVYKHRHIKSQSESEVHAEADLASCVQENNTNETENDEIYVEESPNKRCPSVPEDTTEIRIEVPDDMFVDEYNAADTSNNHHAITNGAETTLHARRRARWGVSCFSSEAGVIFTGVTIISLGIIGCILAPAISIETKPIWDVVQSGNTFEQAVSEYSVFRVFCLVLFNARFILDTPSDYVGLGLLLTVAIVSSIIFPLMQFFAFLRRWWCERKSQTVVKSSANKSMLLSHVERQNVWKYVEVYVFAFIIACWQLGAMSLYGIHYYCDFLEKVYGMLVYIGISKPSSVQCFRVQASHPSTLLVIFGAFMILLASFLYATAVQIRRNKAYALVIEEQQTTMRQDDIQSRSERQHDLVASNSAAEQRQDCEDVVKLPELVLPSDDEDSDKLSETASLCSI